MIEQESRSCGVRWWLASARRFAAWLLVGAAFAALTLFASSTTRKLLKIDYASAHHDWETVLSAAHGLSPSVYPDYANQDVNLALHHLGRLPEDMFRYPQRRLFCEHGFGSRGRLFSRKAFDLFLQLGRVNDAEVIAHNDFEVHPSAAFLLRIARVKLIKREIGAARLYLNVLRDDSCYGRWADSCLQSLADAREPGEPEMEEIRSRMLTEDDVGRTHVRLPDGTWSVSAEEALASLLNRNPRNRMAFEYLMALHLLNRDHASVVRALSRLKAFAYRQTPQLYEEAALLHAGNQSRKPRMTSTGIEIDGIAIRRSTLNRFLRLYALERTYRGFDNPDAQDALLREFGHSYFAYAFGAGAREHE